MSFFFWTLFTEINDLLKFATETHKIYDWNDMMVTEFMTFARCATNQPNRQKIDKRNQNAGQTHGLLLLAIKMNTIDFKKFASYLLVSCCWTKQIGKLREQNA